MENVEETADKLTDAELRKIWAKTSPYSWRVDYDDPMILNITDTETDEVLFRIYIGAVLEAAGRTAILEYCLELEKSPWVTTWHDTESRAAWEILRNDNQTR